MITEIWPLVFIFFILLSIWLIVRCYPELKEESPREEKSPVDLWVEALESGEYKQGVGQLQDSQGRFCCLGVACKVYEKYTGRTLNISLRDSGTLGNYPEVKKWLNLRTKTGSFSEEVEKTSLIGLNDEWKLSFKEIAQVIKSRPQGLFIEEK